MGCRLKEQFLFGRLSQDQLCKNSKMSLRSPDGQLCPYHPKHSSSLVLRTCYEVPIPLHTMNSICNVPKSWGRGDTNTHCTALIVNMAKTHFVKCQRGQSSQTLRVTSPMHLSTSRCSQTPLELSKVLSHSPREFSSGPESTYSYEGAFRMLRDLTYRIVEFWSSWKRCPDLRETSTEDENSAQLCRILREQPRPLRSSTGDLVPYTQSSGYYITMRHFVSSYLSLL